LTPRAISYLRPTGFDGQGGTRKKSLKQDFSRKESGIKILSLKPNPQYIDGKSNSAIRAE